MQAGMLRKAGSGLFSLLPSAFRSLDKLISIVDEEMMKINAQRLSLPLLLDKELWERTGRWNAAGDELFRLKDRREHDYCLAPTHEESVTSLFSDEPWSYRLFPQRLYQSGQKFRDEIRPRQGLLRCREFWMKDLYTFDISEEAAETTYQQVRGAYSTIFSRLGLPFLIAQADSGLIGGTRSQEFHLLTPVGDDLLLRCSKAGCDYAANQERAISRRTPAAEHQLFTLTYSDQPVARLRLPTNIPPNLAKVRTAFMESNDKEWAPDLFGISSSAPAAAELPQLVHSENCDLAQAEANDPCPVCGQGYLTEHKGIEVGHIFHLGTKYSKPLNASFISATNERLPLNMGCYGLGLTRILAAAGEVLHDEKGLALGALAPHSVLVTAAASDKPEQVAQARQLAELIAAALPPGEVVLDDRPDRLGAKLTEGELIGFPVMLIAGRQLTQGQVEVHDRKTGQKSFVSVGGAPAHVAELLKRVA